MRAFGRILMLLIGLGLLAAGVLGLLVELDVLGASDVNSFLGYQEVFDWWRDRDWLRDGSLWILLGAGIVVALVALTLLFLELRPRGPAKVSRAPLGGKARGETHLKISSLIDAIERDVSGVPGVDSASVSRLSSRDEPPEVDLVVVIGPDADAQSAGRASVQRASSAVGRALGSAPAQVRTTVKASRPRGGTRNGRVE